MKRITILLISCLLIVFSNGYAQRDIVTGLKAYYPFSGNADDATGHGFHGTAVRAELTTDRSSNPNSAYEFIDTLFPIISLPAVACGLAAGAVSVWFYAYTWTPNTNGIGLYASGENNYDVLMIGCHPSTGSNQLAFGIFDTLTGMKWALSSIIPVVNTWYNVVGTWGPNGMKIYVNGFLRGSNPYTAPVLTKPAFVDVIGASTFSFSHANGKIDEVRVYERTLSSGDIYELFSGSSGITEHLNQEIDLFPNPAADFVQITGLQPGQYIYSISDLAGKKLSTQINENRIELTGLPHGMYCLTISDLSGRFIKELKLFKQ